MFWAVFTAEACLCNGLWYFDIIEFYTMDIKQHLTKEEYFAKFDIFRYVLYIIFIIKNKAINETKTYI